MTKNKLTGFAKESLFYGLGDGIGRLTSIILVPILSRIFLPCDYGIIDILTLGYNLLLIGIRLNLLTGLQRYYFQKNYSERKILVSSVIVGLTAFSLLVGGIISLGSNYLSIFAFKNAAHSISIIILALCMPFDNLFNILLIVLRLEKRPILFSIFNILRVILTTFLTYILVVWMKAGIKGVFTSQLIALVILVCILLYQARNKISFQINHSLLKEVTIYSLPGHPAVIIASLMSIIPTYILALFSNLTAVGLFGITRRVANIMNLFIRSFNKAWNPFAFENAGKDDERSLYEKVFKIYVFLLIFIGLVLSIFSKEILQFLTPEKYHQAYKLVGGVCVYYIFTGLRTILSTSLYSVNKVGFTSYLNIIHLIIFVICSLLLVPKNGAVGLIISLDVSGLIFAASYISVIKKYFECNLELIKLSLILLSGVLGVIVFDNLLLEKSIMILGKCLFVIGYGIIAYVILLSETEKDIIRSGVVTIAKRLKSS